MAQPQHLLPKSLPGRIGLALLLLTLVGFAGFLGYRLGTPGEEQDIAGPPSIGGPFELVDSEGAAVTDRDLLGRYALIYFGYTYCPDVCPTSLATMARALDSLEASDPEAAAAIQPVFISIDPERDTPEAVGSYVEAFHPRLLGLTGTLQQVEKAARAYRVIYRKVTPEEASDYLMDHSSAIYLIGPDGRFRTHFTHETTSDEMAARLAKLVTPPQS